MRNEKSDNLTFPFSKLFLSTYQSEDGVLYKGLRLYYIYQDNHLIGQYFRQGTKQFYSIQGSHFKIESTEKWYKKAHYKIIKKHSDSDEHLGEYLITRPYDDTFAHYPDVPYTNPYLKVAVNETEYEFRRLRSHVEYWLFDYATWGHYSFGLYDKQDICAVIYSFKIENPILDGSINFNNNLEGTIECDENNLFLSLAGLFLLERFFDDQDRSG